MEGHDTPSSDLHTALRAARIGLVWEVDDRVVEVDPLACELLGAGRSGLVGTRLDDHLQPVEAPWPWFRASCSSAAVRTLEVTSTPVARGDASGRVVTIRDASRHHDLYVRSRGVERAQESFIQAASHDLRGPLRRVKMFCELLLNSGDVATATGVDHARRAIRGATETTALLDRLLRSSSASDPGRVPDLACISVDRALRNVLADLAPEITSTGGTIETSIEGRVLADAEALEHALRELLDNAIKYVSPGEVPRIVVRSARRGDELDILVEDRGIGIHAEHRERIFLPFERLHGRSQHPGYGLGLATARRALDRMNARLVLGESGPDGSTFIVTVQAA